MTTYAQAVNDYVDSRRAGLHTGRPGYEACQAPYINPEWFEMLQQYYRELDNLRQDWALEVLGRRFVRSVYFHQLEGDDILSTEWPARNRHSMKTLAKRLEIRLRARKQRVFLYWEFHFKQRLLPLRWGPLQDHYMRLITEIQHKYCPLLGLFGLVDLGKNRLFPTGVHEIVYGWRQWYPGQEIMQVKVYTVSSPPAHSWIFRVYVTARDGTLLYTELKNPSDTFLRDSVDDWRDFGFPR